MNLNFNSLLTYILIVNCSIAFGQTYNNSLSRIIELRQKSSSTELDIKRRIALANKAMDLSYNLDIDSTILKSGRNLSYLHLLDGNLDKHKKLSLANLNLAIKLDDSLAIAFTNQNLGYNYQFNREYDSAYYYYSRAITDFEILGRISDEISVINNLSIILSDSKDYIGSDELIIEGIELAEKIPSSEAKLDDLRSFYDRLATNAMAMDFYDKSIEYHERALDLSNQMQDGYYNRLMTYNNMAGTYRKKGEFKRALELYNLVYVEDKIFEVEPDFYPLILENIAYTRYLSGDKNYNEIEILFKKGYRISDSLDVDKTKLAVAIDMAKFYYGINKIDSSSKYAQESYKIARDITENDILLESMLLLSKMSDGEESEAYLNEYIQLNDSILQKERTARNKVARIKFETDEIEKENEKITQQRQWLLGISAGLLLTSFLIYIIFNQRSKNKELKFIQDQQKANEEIYNLMLSQQDKVEEARANEKKRISQEIHDGVLGKMFGVRLSLDSLNFSTGPEAIKNRSTYINELQTIEQEIRQISHDLNTDFVSGSSFASILAELIEKQTTAYNLKYTFNYEDNIAWEKVDNKTKINIYRILQETLQNIYKHAEANQVIIGLSLKNNVISLSIIDDGKGFDINKSKKGIGIKNINSRAEAMHGQAEFKSVVNEGTTVIIKVPHNID